MTTYQKAKEMAKAGDFDAAWEIAKHDDSMNDGVTKDEWIAFVKKAIANDQ